MLNNMPSISSGTMSGSIGLDLPSIALQEIYIVTYFKDGTDNSFDGHNTLLSGSGNYGKYRTFGDSGTANWFTGSNIFNDGGIFKNGSTSSSTNALPMPATLLRIKSSTPRIQTRGILYNKTVSGRGWIGGIGEIVGVSSTASNQDCEAIEGYLAHKMGLE